MAVTLYSAHRLLISFAIALGALLPIWGIVQYVRVGDAAALATGLVGAAACAALIVYLRWFVRKRK